jgi:general secretion pathway protein I
MNRTRGFTLVEVLVALAVFAVAAAALSDNITSVLRAQSQLEERTVAFWVAQNQMARLQLQPDWPTVGLTRGQTSEPTMGRDWYWQIKVSPTPAPRLRRVDIEIRKDPDQTLPDATLTGFIARKSG